MKVSDKMIAFLKEREGLYLKAYHDKKGKLTIGYGHTSGVKITDTITEEQAEALLRDDLSDSESQVSRLGLPNLTQGQFDALVDLNFNIGIGQLRTSTLLKRIRSKASVAEIQRQFRRWNKCGGEVMPGLVIRREWDAQRWTETD
jgi:lysozyme